MPLNPKTYTEGHHFIQQLDAHNPWWGPDDAFEPAGGVDARRDAYRRAVRQLASGDASLHVLCGFDRLDRARLLEQLIATVIRPSYQEQYLQDTELRAQANDCLVPPDNVMMLPLGASPLHQLRPVSQLQAVVDHFLTHIATPDAQAYLFLEDLHELHRPGRRGADDNRWLEAIVQILGETDRLTVVASAPSSEQITDGLLASEEASVDRGNWAIDSFTHLSFSEFLRLRHRTLDVAPTDQRFVPAVARKQLETAVRTGAVAPFVDALETEADERSLDRSTVRREATLYTVAGGNMTTQLARNGISPPEDAFERTLRNRGDQSISAFQSSIVERIRQSVTTAADRLYQLKDSAGPERLAAVVAHDRPVDPVAFDDLSSILEADRRTIRQQHLRVLTELNIFGGTPAYANKRPRRIGLFHRDPSVVAAFAGVDLRDVLRGEPQLADTLGKTAAFDHVVRLSQRLNDAADPKRGVVKHWRGEAGVVDFILKIGGRPVPVLWAPDHTVTDLQAGARTASYDALISHLGQSDSLEDADHLSQRNYTEVPEQTAQARKAVVANSEYHGRREGDEVIDGETPFGIVVTNARAALEDGIVVSDSGPAPIVQIPLWKFLRLG